MKMRSLAAAAALLSLAPLLAQEETPPPGAESPEALFQAAKDRVNAEDWKGFLALWDREGIREAFQAQYDGFQKKLEELGKLPEGEQGKKTEELAKSLGVSPEQAKGLSFEDYVVRLFASPVFSAVLKAKYGEGSIGEFQVDESGTRAKAEITFKVKGSRPRGEGREKKAPFTAVQRDGRWFLAGKGEE